MIWLRKVICDFALRLLSKVKTHTVMSQVVEWVKAHGSEIEGLIGPGKLFGTGSLFKVGKDDVQVCFNLRVVKVSLPGGKVLEIPLQFIKGSCCGTKSCSSEDKGIRAQES